MKTMPETRQYAVTTGKWDKPKKKKSKKIKQALRQRQLQSGQDEM